MTVHPSETRPSLPQYGVEALYRFALYQTREDYEKTAGAPAPAFDARRAPKYWADPEAAKSATRNVSYLVLALGADGISPAADDSGRPFLEMMSLSKFEAAAVNIPPTGATREDFPEGPLPAVPVPLKPLLPSEQLVFGFGGTPMIRGALWESSQAGVSAFTPADRALLRAIAAKLGL